MRWLGLVLLLVGAAGGESPALVHADRAWLSDKSWDDGAAVISVFRGKLRWYGELRDAEVRHYAIREYLHPTKLTKMEPRDASAVPVIKVNVLVSFNTGTYPYRQMCSLFIHREHGTLVKATASSQDGCGVTHKRFAGQTLSYDSYWGNEGVGEMKLTKNSDTFFPEELAFLSGILTGDTVDVLPSLLTSHLRGKRATGVERTRNDRETKIGAMTYRHDKDRFLEGWTGPGGESFTRVSKKRLYYWEYTGNGDEERLK